MRLWPLFLKLEGRRVLVVGAGRVAERKVAELVDAAASILVVAPDVEASIETMAKEGRVELRRRPFVASDVDDAWLVIAATGDRVVNRAVTDAATERRVFVNAVDDPDNATAFFASVIRRPPFVVAISSTGELPALSRLLREILEAVLPEERFIEAARALRRKWRAEHTPMASRFSELVAAMKDAR